MPNKTITDLIENRTHWQLLVDLAEAYGDIDSEALRELALTEMEIEKYLRQHTGTVH